MRIKKKNSLGLLKSEKDTSVVVAMSGGVDSSTVAGLMKKEGYNVIGITLKLYDDIKASVKSRQCCSGQDVVDAKRVSNQLNIDHKILYYQKKFKEGVIDNFVDSYLKGETPIPCTQCNQTVKFRDLYDVAKDLKADALVTGHYVKSFNNNGISEMYRAVDHARDQSYFLFNTTQKQLNYLRFPLGDLQKKETREIARELNLNVADKPDSQDICFVPNGDYTSVIRKFKPESYKKGNIKDLNGKVIGTHEGIINFTIGQRKGIKIANKEPLYIVKINSLKNEIIVGHKHDLEVDEIKLRNLNFLCDDIKKYNSNLFAKIRSTGELIKTKILFVDNIVKIKLDKKESGVSSGQACVFYSKDSVGDKVLGGGWIESSY
jgi:tRNA-specific 2-thiouridylase